MFQVIFWNDLQGDFIEHRDRETRKIVLFDNELDAWATADTYKAKNIQAKVEYVRRQFVDKEKKRRPRAGRIKRIPTVVFFGERVRVVGVVGK